MHTFVEFLQTHPNFYLSLIFLVGLVVGSFLNVVIIRLPKMIERNWQKECCDLLEINNPELSKKEIFNLVNPPSQCPFCKHKIISLAFYRCKNRIDLNSKRSSILIRILL